MLLKFSKVLLHVSLLSVVVVVTSAFFPFIGGKDYFFRFAVELALIFFILSWAFESRGNEVWHRIKEVARKPLFIAVSTFVFVVLLSTIFAFDPNAAFWSNFERGEGMFQMLHYYIFFALLVIQFTTKEDWRWFFKTFLVSATLMIFYGILADTGMVTSFISQYQGAAETGPVWLRPLANRFQGSLGNPAYVAPYLMFSLFFTMYLWVTSPIVKRRIKNSIYGVLTFFFLLFFMVTQTRGAFVGLLVAAYAFLVFIGFMEPRYRLPSFGGIAALLVGTGILVHFKTSTWLQAIPGGRMFDLPLSTSLLGLMIVGGLVVAALIEFAREQKFLWWVLAAVIVVGFIGGGYMIGTGKINLADPTTSTRFWTWGSAWQGIKERPILGWGLENFTTVFDKYFDPRHFIPGQSTETWFDRAHSIYFDYLAETGILGLASYLGIFAVIYAGLLWKKTAAHLGKFSLVEKGLLVALPVGYLVQGVAIFDVLPIYVNLFALFAFGYYFLYAHHEERGSQAAHHSQ